MFILLTEYIWSKVVYYYRELGTLYSIFVWSVTEDTELSS